MRNLIKISFIVMAFVTLFACKNEKRLSTQEIEQLKKPVSKTNANWLLFMDDYWIASSKNITSTLHQPEKYKNNPIIKAEVPWEQNPYCFGTVIYDEEESIFKFWYQSYNYGESVAERTSVLYATSKNGTDWERPILNLHTFKGSTENNIVMGNYGFHDLYSPSVIKDTLDSDPNKRYKMIWWDFPLGEGEYQDDGMCVAFSADGIHWNKHPDNPVLRANKTEKSISDVMSVMQDKNTGKFVAYTKGWAKPWPSHRQIVRVESTDFIHWSEPEVVIRHAFDLKDPQSYGMTTSQYGNNYIGLLYSYKKPGNETIDVQLTISHDNKKWNRVANQKTFLPLGKEGEWDDGMLFNVPLFNHDNKTLIYYSGWDNSHDSKERRHSGIGLATLRMNGFVSLDASDIGNVTTHLIKNASGLLLVNANAVGGSLRAELVDTSGNVITGYSKEECVPVTKDGVVQLIRWKNHSELPENIDKIRFRFTMKHTELYGFYAGKDAVRAQVDNYEYSVTKGPSLPRDLIRGGHAAGVVDGCVIVVGGTNWSEDKTTKFWLDNSAVLKDGRWEAGPALPKPMAYSMSGLSDKGLLIAGGKSNQNTDLKDVYLLSSLNKNEKWKTLPQLPEAVSFGAGAVLKGKFYAACGSVGNKQSNRMWKIDVNHPENGWTECNPVPGAGRLLPAFVTSGKYLYLIGGADGFSPLKPLNEIYRYNPKKDEWKKLNDLPLKGYAWTGQSIDDKHILLTGRSDGSIYDGVWIVDLENSSMKEVGNLIVPSATAPLIEIRDNCFWLIGGEPDANKNRTGKVSVINIEKNL